jgi:hypothetical protein
VIDGGSHAANLPVFTFDEFESDPTGGDGFAETDWRSARRNFGLGFENPGAAGEGFVAMNIHPLREASQCVAGWDSFHLRPVFALVSVAGMKQALVQFRLVAQQEQTFRVSVKSANRINGLWEVKFGERSVGRTVGSEL